MGILCAARPVATYRSFTRSLFALSSSTNESPGYWLSHPSLAFSVFKFGHTAGFQLQVPYFDVLQARPCRTVRPLFVIAGPEERGRDAHAIEMENSKASREFAETDGQAVTNWVVLSIHLPQFQSEIGNEARARLRDQDKGFAKRYVRSLVCSTSILVSHIGSAYHRGIPDVSRVLSKGF